MQYFSELRNLIYNFAPAMMNEKMWTGKQQKILALAKKFFAEKGYTETSMRDLAQQLNIKAATFYSHFKSKEDLLIALCDELYDMMVQNIEFLTNPELSPEKKFQKYLRIHISTLLSYPEIFNIYYKYWHLVNAEKRKLYEAKNFEYFGEITKLVKQVFPASQNSEAFVPHADSVVVINILNSIPELINREKADVDQVVKQVQERIMFGLKGAK